MCCFLLIGIPYTVRHDLITYMSVITQSLDLVALTAPYALCGMKTYQRVLCWVKVRIQPLLCREIQRRAESSRPNFAKHTSVWLFLLFSFSSLRWMLTQTERRGSGGKQRRSKTNYTCVRSRTQYGNNCGSEGTGRHNGSSGVVAQTAALTEDISRCRRSSQLPYITVLFKKIHERRPGENIHKGNAETISTVATP